DEGASHVVLSTSCAPRDNGSNRHRNTRRCNAFRSSRHRDGRPATPSSTAAPPPPVPPPCTAAEMARVMSGVTFDTSNYLTLHPTVNDFFTSLKGQPRDQISAQVQTYLDANPQVRDELQTIRQPSVDFRQRCGAFQTP